MITKAQQNVYIQRDWTEQELVADGFLSYRPVKRITMVRMLLTRIAASARMAS